MNTKTTAAIAIVVIAIVIGSVAAYVYLGSASGSQPAPTPTPTATASPKSKPTATPTATSTPKATTTPGPTASPTSVPTPTHVPTPTPTPSTVSLTGAGASFPYPLLNSMINKYSTDVKPYVQVNYQSIGSGGGIAAMQAKTVDFGASDAPLSASDIVNVPKALHIPETIGAVTVAYNLPGVASGLHLTGQIVADIYLGTITTWNDPAIQNLNTNVTLPSRSIVTVHRSDSSGTTFVFTDYLSLSSSAWNTAVGQGKAVAWPSAPGGVIGSNNNAGVASTVNGSQYSIGYVELAYAVQNGMTVAAIQNPAGSYVLPTLASTTVAAQSVASAGLPAGNASWTSFNLLNAQDQNAYPIVSFTYLLAYKELSVVTGMTQDKAAALVQFLWWVVHDGQNLSPGLAYATLPSNVVTIDEATIRSITFNGQTLPVT
jgi:phosphate transport system substrate-binding protein